MSEHRSFTRAWLWNSRGARHGRNPPQGKCCAVVPPMERKVPFGGLLQGLAHVTLAMELAHRRGLQRIYPVDSQYEAVRTLGFPQNVINDVFANPAQQAWREKPQVQRYLALGK